MTGFDLYIRIESKFPECTCKQTGIASALRLEKSFTSANDSEGATKVLRLEVR